MPNSTVLRGDPDLAPARAASTRGPVADVADRGYDAGHLCRLLAERGVEAVIPSTASRHRPIPCDIKAHKDRNLVERMWCRLKDWRRLATRYDKPARNYLAGALIAAAVTYWIN
jgi:transposase